MAEHGTVGRYARRNGCRCQDCRTAWAAYVKTHQARREASHPEHNPNLQHGSPWTYRNWRCRCEKCRAAHRAYERTLHERRKGREPITHGTRSTYKHWSCRCAACRAASAAWERQRREKQT